MNHSNPIIICDENEEFRILIRDMLTKNGFFHVLEASNSSEAIDFLSDKKESFVLVDAKSVSEELLSNLVTKKHFLVFSHAADEKGLNLSARLGVDHVMSYPFHSNKLLEKMHSLF